MTIINLLIFIVLITINNVYGFSNSLLQNKMVNRNKISMININDIDFQFLNKYSLLLSKIETSKTVPDDYVYGQVSAPGWVLPVAAVAVIAIAAVPILLSSGEKALEQQRVDEETTGSQFGKNRKKDV